MTAALVWCLLALVALVAARESALADIRQLDAGGPIPEIGWVYGTAAIGVAALVASAWTAIQAL